MATDTKLTHAREFTTIEVQGLTLWNALQDAGNAALAAELLDATLMHEHYTSLLSDVVAERSAAQVTQQALLRFRFDTLVQLAQQFLDQRSSGSSGDITELHGV